MKIRWMKRVAAATLGMLAIASLTACNGAADDGDASGGKLTLVGGLPQNYNPAEAIWGGQSISWQAVFDSLLLATADGTIEPWLATEWSYNDDNTELTLTLRDDVTFTDGSKLTGDVVVQNLQRFKDGTSPDAGYLASVESIAAPDDTTVVLTLSAPDPALLGYLSRTAGLIGSAENFDNPDISTQPVGSGPYIVDLDQSVEGASFVYAKNPDYWNPDVQYYDSLEIKTAADGTAALNIIRAGEANGVYLTNNDLLDQVEAAGWTVNADERNFAGLILMDRNGTLVPALADARVRQAINYAFDKPALLAALQADHGTPTSQIFSPISTSYEEDLDDYYTYDPEMAKRLLAEAGYPDGFVLPMPQPPQFGANTFALINQQLSDIGITTEEQDSSNLLGDLFAPKYPAIYLPLDTFPDWHQIQFMIAPRATFNPFRVEDPVANELIQQIQFGDEATSEQAMRDLNRYVVEQAWFAPFYRVQNSFATDPNTTARMIPTNNYPSLYDIQPKP